jgi:hypothetical protein
MIKNKFLQQIKVEIPTRFRRNVRRYADAITSKKEESDSRICKNCKCQDLEDWFDCHNKK